MPPSNRAISQEASRAQGVATVRAECRVGAQKWQCSCSIRRTTAQPEKCGRCVYMIPHVSCQRPAFVCLPPLLEMTAFRRIIARYSGANMQPPTSAGICVALLSLLHRNLTGQEVPDRRLDGWRHRTGAWPLSQRHLQLLRRARRHGWGRARWPVSVFARQAPCHEHTSTCMVTAILCLWLLYARLLRYRVRPDMLDNGGMKYCGLHAAYWSPNSHRLLLYGFLDSISAIGERPPPRHDASSAGLRTSTST